MTDRRFTLHVPDPVVPTSINLGAAWSGTPPDAGTAFNGRGLCVNSAGRVWLDANGAAATSTFSALSNAAEGQLLFQSVGNAVMCISKESNVISSNAGVFLAGGSGVKMIAGHGAPLLFGAGDDSIKNVRPDQTEPSSDHAAAYTDHLDTVAKGWTIADTVVAATLTALDVGLLIAECCKGSRSPSADLGMALLIGGSAANLAGGTVNVCGMEGSDLPGLNLHAFSNINLATTGFCSMYAGAGMLLFGGTTGGLGFVTAGVTGFVNASLKSVLLVGVEGKNASLTGSTKLELNARTGSWEFSGPIVQVGTENALADTSFAKTQLPTMTVTGDALTSITVDAKRALTLESRGPGSSTAYEGGTIDVDAGMEITIKGPTYEISVRLGGVQISVMKQTKVTARADSVTFDVMNGQTLKVDASSVTLGGKAVNLKIDAAGSVVWTAPLAAFV